MTAPTLQRVGLQGDAFDPNVSIAAAIGYALQHRIATHPGSRVRAQFPPYPET